MKRSWIAGAALLLLIAAGAGYFWSGNETLKVVELPLVEECQLHQARCTASLPNGMELQFEMGPKPLPTAEPMVLQAVIVEGTADRVEVLFEGKDMYMGFLQYRLKPTEEIGHYRGKGSLSLCTRRLMEWIARVKVTIGDVQYEVPFAFETLHP